MKLQPQGSDATSRWEEYVTKGTAWNHVRVAAALGAAALLTVALHAGGASNAGSLP